jgi:hypothetical protein
VQLIESKIPDPSALQLTVASVSGELLVTVAVQVAPVPTGTELGLQVTMVSVSARVTVVGLKFAVIVPKSFIVAVVLADRGSAIVMADASLTLQPEKA